jgi:hypothetical protein
MLNSGRETLLLKDDMGGQEDGLISCGSCVSLYLRKTFSEFRRWKCARAYRKHVAATSAPLLSVHVSDEIFFFLGFYMRIFLLSSMIEILLKVSWKLGLSFTDNVHITVAKTH